MPSAAFYSEPSSRRESYSSRACSPPTALRFYSNQPSPASTPPGRVLKGLTKPPGPTMLGEDSDKTTNVLRSSSVENMKTLDSSTTNEEARLGELPPSAAYDTQLHQRMAKSPYSTLPHSTSKALRRQLAEQEADVATASASIPSPLKSPQVPPRSMPATPSTPLSVFKSSAHSLVGGQQSQQLSSPASAHPSPHHHPNGVTFGKRFFLLRRNKRTTSAPELGWVDFSLSFNATIALWRLCSSRADVFAPIAPTRSVAIVPVIACLSLD